MEREAQIGFDGLILGGPGFRQELSLAESAVKACRRARGQRGFEGFTPHLPWQKVFPTPPGSNRKDCGCGEM